MDGEEFCYACGAGLKDRKGDRRLIGSARTQHVMPMLRDVATRAVAESGNVQLDEEKLSTGYICRPCFREFEKVQKLQQQLKSVQEHLYINAKTALPHLPTLPAQSLSQTHDAQGLDDNEPGSEEDRCSTSQLGQKRSLDSPSPGSLKKRRLQLRKIRHAPVVAGNTTSPPIAVSLIYIGVNKFALLTANTTTRQVTVFYPKKPRSYYMTPTRRQICKPLARGSRCALARRCLKDRVIRKFITKGVGLSLRHEIASLCSDKVGSILRDKSSLALETFSWEAVMDEMKTTAPTLLSLLESCTKTRKARKNRKAVIGIIAAILCKHRRPTASLLQRLVSVVLYSGHASKNVSFSSFRPSQIASRLHTIQIYFRSINGYRSCSCVYPTARH